MNALVFAEMKAVYSRWFVWVSLARQDIHMRYRRSILGPLWITISMAVTIYSLGFLYGNLFHVQLERYFPHLASGIIGWSLISSLFLESSNVFVESESYIKSQESFFSLFMMRLIIRNVLVFMHNIVTFIPIALIFKLSIGLKTLLIIPGLLIIGVNTFFWGTLLGIIGTRYRDFPQIVSSIIQVVFFITPIMWMPSTLSANVQWIVQYNPFNHFLNLIRCPLMQEPMYSSGFTSIMLITSIGFVLYSVFVKTYKHRIVFWL